MSDFYVGNRATSFSEFPEYKEYTRVSLYYDSETLKATVGNDTGREMVLVSPFLPISTSDCETLAQNILNELSGFNYQPFKATGAELDPSADLGDTLTVGGIESFIGQLDTTFNQAFISDINTPSGDDIEHEYPYVSQEQRQIERTIATTRSLITKTAEEIRLEVANELDSLSSSIDVKLGSITSTVQGLNGKISTLEQTDSEIRAEITDQINSLSSSIDVKLGSITSTVQGLDGRVTTVEQTATGLTSTVQGLDSNVSSIEQKVDSIRIDVTTKDGVSTIELTGTGITASSAEIDLSGFVTFNGLSGGTTTIDGACIKTGTIDAERLNLTGAITFGDLDTDAQNTINGISNTASNAMSKATSAYNLANSIDIPNYIKSTYIGRTIIKSPTIKGNNMEVYGAYKVLDASDSTMGYMGAATGMDATGSVTYGVALASSATVSGSGEDGITYATTGNYVIATSGGCRMQAGNDSIVVTSESAELNYGNGSYRIRVSNNGCQYYDGSWHNIGSGSGSSIPVWG